MRRSIGTTSTRDVVHMSEMPNANNAVSLPLTLRTKTSYVKDEPVLSIGASNGAKELRSSSPVRPPGAAASGLPRTTAIASRRTPGALS
jgi:hypothetical protein